jgi:hypothetical protein
LAWTRHPAFNSLIERVKFFEGADCPETNSTPISMSEAGFFYDRKLITFSNILYLSLNPVTVLFILVLCLFQNGPRRTCVFIATVILLNGCQKINIFMVMVIGFRIVSM